ncbi:hypothetical protein COT48_03565 [Candidatus Woesearchaeota archaeon CG08_land_8_20_14_0_20_47_9]|nr:MAG: hypothetical protein AUJ69_01185 [Candidatus Woesearchaeota archaeon CG1_02_47_18]PIO03756.1 MAG: hypothetical protein COT48_03565 [Candidatus Woesearchaeota archaeon CG08_land_8_20_14_0_20_47_9]HII30380.1 hypothetical protein [Candidatus Woesearchaeota archaeon]
MEFWNSALTEKSWNALVQLRQKKFDFIVIGGWAAYLWTRLHKSKDVDIVIKNFEDLAILKRGYDLVKNDHLKKYEIKVEEIDIDIYVPYFSELTIPADELINHAAVVQGFEVVKPEALLILKQGAELDRERSVKGGKDRIDIMTLILYADIDFDEYFKLLKKYKLEFFYERLKNIISNFKDIKYIEMNPREFKLRKEGIVERLKMTAGS